MGDFTIINKKLKAKFQLEQCWFLPQCANIKTTVDPRLRSQKKVNNVHLPSNRCTTDLSNIYE